MTFDEMDLTDMPPNYDFAKLVDKEFYLWGLYKPTTIEADFPFGQDWWKYLYWMPTIKKDFYLLAIKALHFERELQDLAINKYGMDYWFFTRHYDFFIKRLQWMRKQGSSHIGEIK